MFSDLQWRQVRIIEYPSKNFKEDLTNYGIYMKKVADKVYFTLFSKMQNVWTIYNNVLSGLPIFILRFSMVLILLFSIRPLAGYSQSWHNLTSGVQSSSGGAVVYSISCDTAHRLIYVGGDFDTAGNITARYIATWNGITWDSLGSGMNAPVQVTLFHNDTLYVGGDFTMAASVSFITHTDSLIAVNHIARWNGLQWDSIGAGMNGSVYALAVFNGMVYAGGNFTIAGRVHANHIAVWNGNEWDTVGYGFNSDVYCLTVWNGSLYAGGDFDSSGSVKINHIARWNGSLWTGLGAGMNNYVNALMPYRGLFYAAGNFDTAGGKPVDYISVWNGSFWDTVGEGVNQETSALDTNNGILYVGGYFTTAENITVNGIAGWNGAVWDSLSSGVGSGSVVSIASYKAGIFAGGNFSIAGYDSANSIAFWDTSALLKLHTIKPKADEVTVYPNPADGFVNVSVLLPEPGTVLFCLYNVLGQVIIHEQLGAGLTNLPVNNISGGIYLYRVTDFKGNLLKAGKEIIN